MSIFSRFIGKPVNQVNPEQVSNQLRQKPAPILVDVRQPEEYIQGHIGGAKLIPLSELRQRLTELPNNREIICVCRSGNRSDFAARQLDSAGYKVSNLQGGMIAWARAGHPIKKGSAS
jgi:rhodanese-related sulfurtransferase